MFEMEEWGCHWRCGGLEQQASGINHLSKWHKSWKSDEAADLKGLQKALIKYLRMDHAQP